MRRVTRSKERSISIVEFGNTFGLILAGDYVNDLNLSKYKLDDLRVSRATVEVLMSYNTTNEFFQKYLVYKSKDST